MLANDAASKGKHHVVSVNGGVLWVTPQWDTIIVEEDILFYIISGLSREFNQLVYVLVAGKMVSIILCSCFIFTTIPSQYYILWLFVTVQILNIAVLLT